jgi:KipI family sensor histidine kinase inhibitor
LDPRLHVPRRATPRTKVAAGSVAIASEYSAVYPRSSPGGWHLLGTTTTTMWDVDRMPPSLLQPGDTVRFIVTGIRVDGAGVNDVR